MAARFGHWVAKSGGAMRARIRKRMLHGIAAMVANLLASCSLRPLPGDYFAEATPAIVAQIRCEASFAVSQDFGSNPKHALVYRDAAIGYEFNLTAKESEGAGVSLGLVRPLVAGTLGLNLSATASGSRQNQQTFIVSDRFSYLASGATELNCEHRKTAQNYVYPITGNVGIAGVIQNYLVLSDAGGLVGSEAAPTVPQYSEKLTFTTDLSVSATPTLVLSPAGRRWQTTKVSAVDPGLDVARHDEHMLQIVISSPVPPQNASRTGRYASRPAHTRLHEYAGSRPGNAVKLPPAEKVVGGANALSPAQLNAIRGIGVQNTKNFFQNIQQQNQSLGIPSY